ncbi:hypothetical protein CAEBREN_23656 [Caenorhabditis brenneri]|uniref:Uncharacterized protein n=1 Tax=Caenorhabditis brenneri TaxID=135651 RepID=G0NKS0_CAEBE|nr:hypothetical protein CAEBREN_23656 [Caenorhabditis brenneri]
MFQCGWFSLLHWRFRDILTTWKILRI